MDNWVANPRMIPHRVQASCDFAFFICLSLSFLIIMPSFTFVVLSFFSRGKEHTRDMLLARERHTNIFSPDFTSCFRTLALFPESERQRVSFERSGFPHSSLLTKVHIALVRQFLALPLLYFCINSKRLKEINYIQIGTLSYEYGASRSLHGQVSKTCRKNSVNSLNFGPVNFLSLTWLQMASKVP